MLLILSNSQDETTNYLEDILRQNDIQFIRFDTDLSLDLIRFRYEVGKPQLEVDGNWYAPDNFDNVWYRRPERLKSLKLDGSVESKFAIEEWAEALEAFFSHIPSQLWMNHPSINVAASHKLEQLTLASAIGFNVPATLVTHEPSQLREFYNRLSGKIIAKPMSAGYLER